jgi:DNA modification methylase
MEFATYEEFIESKRRVHKHTGFTASLNSSHLFPFQNYVVNKALLAGKFGVFSGTGTGKTRMQVNWCNDVSRHTGKPTLILCPLAVSGQTINEAKSIDIPVSKLLSEPTGTNIYIINYDQLDNIVKWIPLFGGIALDEASILKNHEGAYRNMLIEVFKDTQFKSVWSATPSPNSPMEIGNYSEFLDVMPRQEMLAMYFVHDGGETSQWRLKGHGKKVFWEWVSTWAIMFQKPSDIGFEQDGYDLPPLNLIEKQIVTPQRNENSLFNDTAVSATNFNKELRLTKIQRLDEVIEIIKSRPNETFIIWIKQGEEGQYLRKLIPEMVEVQGSDDNDYKEEKLLGFAAGKFPYLLTKTRIAAWGMNFQNCGNHVFASPDFSFESVFQAIRRSLRFGRIGAVNAWIMTTDTMQNVLKSFKTKQRQHEEMQAEMTAATNRSILKKTKEVRKFQEYKTDKFLYQMGDCVKLIRDIPAESIGMSIFSPPFPTLYVYSDEIEDMGNCKDFNEFRVGFRFMVKDMFRVLWSGRNMVVHCMDIPIQKGKEGYIGLRDFSGMIIEDCINAGFIYHSRVTLRKSPVTEMQRTKALGLLHKQIKKDASMSRVGIPDYLLIFRKPGEHNHTVVHQDTDPNKENYLPVSLWQKYAEPIWDDIDQGNTLNAKNGKDNADERHIAPLQLDTIYRSLHLWSNEGDTILTPYGGIGSEGYEAVRLKRKAILFELKKSYFDEGVKNLLSAEASLKTEKLF